MSKKELAIVFGITSNLTFALGNVLIGLKKYSPHFADEIIVFHDGIIANNKKILNSIIPCRFIDYEFPIKDTSMFYQFSINHFSKLAYSRYECFYLLNEFKKVIWLDVDILIQKDISGLEKFGETGFGILAPLAKDFKIIDQFLKPLDHYDMGRKAYSSGTLILQDNLVNFDKMKDWCYEKTIEYADRLYLPDQAILNLLIQEFDIKVSEINLENYCCHPHQKNRKNAYILHSYWPEKFWNFHPVKEWYENYEQWVKMGGTPTKTKKANIFARFYNKILPEAPNPLKKPRQFAMVIYARFKKLFKK